jgi:hypothetical protein
MFVYYINLYKSKEPTKYYCIVNRSFWRQPRQPDWTVRVYALPTMFCISQLDVTYSAAQSTS